MPARLLTRRSSGSAVGGVARGSTSAYYACASPRDTASYNMTRRGECVRRGLLTCTGLVGALQTAGLTELLVRSEATASPTCTTTDLGSPW